VHQQGIRTARLPIGGRVQLTSSTVLTVNQVLTFIHRMAAQLAASIVQMLRQLLTLSDRIRDAIDCRISLPQ